MKYSDTGKLYGKYVHPLGILFNKSNIEVRKKTLKKLPFFKKIKTNAEILEIGGSGQDAVAFAELGFNTTFIDLSEQNIKKTKGYKLKSKNKIKLICNDFLKQKFYKKYDVIRARGVIHHINEPDKVLKKINTLLKINGFLHFNVYRSGSFYYWFVEHLRKISKLFEIKKFYKILMDFKITKYENNQIGNKTIKAKSDFKNIILDDLFVPICNPGNYNEIKNDLKSLNFKIFNQKKKIINLNHSLIYPDFPGKKNHLVFDCQKKNNSFKNNLNYKIEIDRELKLTKKKKEINSSNNLFKKFIFLTRKKKLNKNPKFIYEIIRLYKDCYLLSVSKKKSESRHEILQKKILKIIDKFDD